MNIDVYTLCWNEMAILPFVIEAWKRFARHVYVFDNGSTDGSIEFLKQYDWITVEHFGKDTEKSNALNSNIKNTKWKGSDADYVVVCDLDECLVGKDVIKTLEDCKKRGATIVETEWYDFINPQNEIPQYEEGKTLYEVSPYATRNKTSKTLVFDPKKITDMNYGVGAHRCYPKGIIKKFKPTGLFVHHINNCLCLDYKLKRYEMQNARRSAEDKRKGWGIHYGWDKERSTRGYNDFLKNKTNFKNVLEKGDDKASLHKTPKHNSASNPKSTDRRINAPAI